MQPPAGIRWQRVPGHHVEYGTYTDSRDQFWIWFRCLACGDVSRKLCYRPQLTTRWALYYADQHGHGLTRRPR